MMMMMMMSTFIDDVHLRTKSAWFHTCQPTQFTSIKYSFFIILGGMAILENGYRKT